MARSPKGATMLICKLSHPKCGLNQTGINLGRLLAQTGQNGGSMAEKNVEHLLNSIDENLGVRAFDYANVINLAINDVNVLMCKLLCIRL